MKSQRYGKVRAVINKSPLLVQGTPFSEPHLFVCIDDNSLEEYIVLE